MSQRTFCDRCDQELVLPAEKIDFVTGQPTSGPGDICWLCRLSEIVDLYNEKTKDWAGSPRIGLTRTMTNASKKDPVWVYPLSSKGDHDAQP